MVQPIEAVEKREDRKPVDPRLIHRIDQRSNQVGQREKRHAVSVPRFFVFPHERAFAA